MTMHTSGQWRQARSKPCVSTKKPSRCSLKCEPAFGYAASRCNAGAQQRSTLTALLLCVHQDLAALLRDDSADVRHNATLAIRNLSDLPAAKTEFVGELAGSLDLLKSVFGAACAEPLCELLESKDPDVRANGKLCAYGYHRVANDRPLTRLGCVCSRSRVRRIHKVSRRPTASGECTAHRSTPRVCPHGS